ncbi:MAG TPA: hypothetical protein VGJ39_13760 [Vicinamibacterales bacterium]
MWSILKKSAVFATAFLVFNGAAARAATVEVKVAFPFVVHGQTMPAGRYLVESEGSNGVLIRGEKGNHADMFVLTIPAVGHDPAGEKPALTFTRHETQYRLSSIWESGTDEQAIVDR